MTGTTVVNDEVNFRRDILVRDFALFALVTAVMGFLTVMLLDHQYVNEVAMERWAKMVGLLETPQSRLAELIPIIPQLPVAFIGSIIHLLGFNPTSAPYVTSALGGAFLLTIWYRHLRVHDYSMLQRVVLLALVALHPAFLLSTIGGSQAALSLIFFYGLYLSCLQLMDHHDIRAHIIVASVICLLFLTDTMSAFISLCMLPLLGLLAPVRMVQRYPVGIYLILGFPLMVVVFSWIYLHWLFGKDPWEFLSMARITAGATEVFTFWQRNFGGQALRPMAAAAGVVVICFPAVIYFFARSKGEFRHILTTVILFISPIIAVGVATHEFFVTHPLQFLAVLLGGVMAEVVRIKANKTISFVVLVLFLVAGTAGGWLVARFNPNDSMEQWYQAMSGGQIEDTHQGDIQLAKWLDEHSAPTLIDERAAYRVVVAMKSAENLMMSFSDAFMIQQKKFLPDAPMIAVPDPQTVAGRIDSLNKRFPGIYEKGPWGYELVYDDQGWRVYKRIAS